MNTSDEEKDKITQATLKSKDTKIKKLETSLKREKYIISFYEQGNKQLEVK